MSTGDEVQLDTPEDEILLAHLRRIAHDIDPPPALMDVLARGAFLLRTLDAELAALVHDSAEPGQELAGVRGDDSVRLLSYEVEAVGLELQVVARGPHRSLTGQVIGPASGPVLVQTGTGEHALHPDDTGVFILRDLPAGRLRISLTRSDGVTVVTPWTVPWAWTSVTQAVHPACQRGERRWSYRATRCCACFVGRSTFRAR